MQGEKKSLEELKKQAGMQLTLAERVEPLVAVTDANWKALLGNQKSLLEMVSQVLEEQEELASMEDLKTHLAEVRRMDAANLDRSMMSFTAQTDTLAGELRLENQRAGKERTVFERTLWRTRQPAGKPRQATESFEAYLLRGDYDRLLAELRALDSVLGAFGILSELGEIYDLEELRERIERKKLEAAWDSFFEALDRMLEMWEAEKAGLTLQM